MLFTILRLTNNINCIIIIDILERKLGYTYNPLKYLPYFL